MVPNAAPCQQASHFPAIKTLEDFSLDHLPSLRKDLLAIGLGVKATQAGYSVLFDTANNWIRRYKLIIIDETGNIPFDQDAANLFFQLVASRYEQGSIMVTNNLPFGRGARPSAATTRPG